MARVFISYSRKDLEFVDRLANDLETAGFEVWYDLSGLEAGSRWGNEIQKAIDSSQYFLVVLSPNSVKSNWVEREFLRASDQGLKIIPLLYQQCSLPMWSLNLHFIDMQGKNYSRKYQELLNLMGVQSKLSEDNPITLHYIKIGDEYRKMGQSDQAIASYLQALIVDPNNLKAQSNIGAIHLEEQAYEEAAAAFKLALQISGEDLLAKAGYCDANLSLGNQARADGKIEEATKFYLEILKISPDDDDARRSLSNISKTQAEDLLAAGKEDEALITFSEALAYTPHDTALSALINKLQDEKKAKLLKELFARSDKELASENWGMAIAALNEALEIAPQDASILKKIEHVHEQQQEEQLKAILLKVEQAEESERWDTAIAGLNEYLQMKHDDKVIQKRMADLMASKRTTWLNAINLRLEQAVESREWEEAHIILNEALEVEPDNKELKARVAQVKKDQASAKINAIILRAEQAASVGRWDDSIMILNNGLIDVPDEKTLKTKLAEVMQFKREEKLKSALNLADMAARAEKWETAVASLNEILASEPDNLIFLEKFDEVLRLERASKLKDLQTQARNLVKAEKFEEALAAWNEQLALEPENRQAVLDEIEAVNKAQKLAGFYSKGTDALANKEHVKAVEFFKRIEMEDAKYKDTAKLRAKAEKRLRSAKESPLSRRRKYWVIGSVLLIVALGIGTIAFWPRENKLPIETTLLSENTDQESVLPKETSLIEDITDQETNTPDPGILNPTPTPLIELEGIEIIVTSAEDDGEGTLRQALLNAQTGDTILFDPVVFPPDNATTIYLTSNPLPRISQGNISIDASDAGVILDGSNLLNDSAGLVISSNRNTIMGLQIFNFSSVAIYLEGGSFNTIGGDRSVGTGPIGQGNLLGGVGYAGIDVLPSSGGNLITGNLIGTNLEGNESYGFWKAGIWFEGKSPEQTFFNLENNTVGPDNIIANNGDVEIIEDNIGGIVIESVQVAVTITENSFFNNFDHRDIIYFDTPDAAWERILDPPSIIYFELETGIVSGQTCDNCLVEIFSTDSDERDIYEGSVTANQYGNFSFRKGGALSGPFLIATTHPIGKSTSEFSQPTAALSEVQMALDAIQNEAPFYQTAFDTWDSVAWQDHSNNTTIQDGKLIVTSEFAHAGVTLRNLRSDRIAVEFEFRFWDADPGGHCIFGTSNEDEANEETLRNISVAFTENGNADVGRYVPPDGSEELAAISYDETITNTFTLLILGDQIAAFMNGQIAFVALDPDGSVVYTNQTLAASYTIVCEFDNYKIWNLSGVDFNP